MTRRCAPDRGDALVADAVARGPAVEDECDPQWRAARSRTLVDADETPIWQQRRSFRVAASPGRAGRHADARAAALYQPRLRERRRRDLPFRPAGSEALELVLAIAPGP
jgi:hypothetical protein